MGRSLFKRIAEWSKRAGTRSRRFDDYDVVRLIHEGEKACVYQARSPKDGGLVAIKAYKPLYNRSARRLCKRYHLRREGEAGLLLNPREGEHAADWPIVRTLGFGHEFDDPDRCYYVIQEYIDGNNVRHLMGCNDPIVRELRMEIAMTVGRALSIIHQRGMIHRDVCMDNVLLTRDRKAKLIDLGFMAPAGVAFEERTGTPSYMAPEQFIGRPLEPMTDIYAFGVLVFELFTGKQPFTTRYPASNPDVASRRLSMLREQHLKKPPPKPSELNPDIPDDLDAVVLKCLEKDPAGRYQRMELVLAELRRCAQSGTTPRSAKENARSEDAVRPSE